MSFITPRWVLAYRSRFIFQTRSKEPIIKPCLKMYFEWRALINGLFEGFSLNLFGSTVECSSCYLVALLHCKQSVTQPNDEHIILHTLCVFDRSTKFEMWLRWLREMSLQISYKISTILPEVLECSPIAVWFAFLVF